MGVIHIMERGGEELREYKKALKMAKEGIEMICELSDDMEDQFGERGDYSRYRMRGYGERGYGERRGSYYRRDDDWDDMSERRNRGRYM